MEKGGEERKGEGEEERREEVKGSAARFRRSRSVLAAAPLFSAVGFPKVIHLHR